MSSVFSVSVSPPTFQIQSVTQPNPVQPSLANLTLALILVFILIFASPLFHFFSYITRSISKYRLITLDASFLANNLVTP
jgi:hypothetical protein